MKVFEWPLRVYIEDTDAGGIVYYVNYLKFIERARTEFLRHYGFDKTAIFNHELMFVVHSLSSEYVKPARLDDELVATAVIEKVGKTYLQMHQQVLRCINAGQSDEHRELLCRADVKIACVDRQLIKPRKIPPVMMAALPLSN